MSFGMTLSSARVVNALVTMPARGLWTARVALDEAKTFDDDARVQLKLGALTLEGAKYRGSAFADVASHHVIAGRGGWRKRVSAKSYRPNSDVKLSKILTDLARDCGEEFTSGFGPGFADRSLGYAYDRMEETASRILTQLLGRAWYVGDDGLTVVGDRADTSRVTAELMDYEPESGCALFATDTPDKVRPGQTFVAGGTTYTIDRVVVELGKRVSVYAWTSPPTTEDKSPTIAAVRSIVEHIFPNLRFMGDQEYEVVSQSGNFVDLRPVDAKAKLPSLPRVQFRGAPGVAGELDAGTKVVVRFVNSDPAKPYVAAMESRDGSNFVPLTLRVDAQGTTYVGESSDLVSIAGGAQFVALANLVKTEIAAAINGHVHGGVTTGSGSTGNATPTYVAGDVAASKVKAT